jgi:MoxR-like ATPase
VLLRRPLLVKGEPGTGKTVLAQEIAKALGAPLIEWNVKSTTKAQQGLYEYDAVARLRDGQLGDERVHDIRKLHQEGQAVGSLHLAPAAVLLIDEIDKADIEFPNDLLQELDRMSFDVYETHETDRGQGTPDRHHHLEQRKGTARRLPAPLLLPLHQVPRSRHDAGDHRRPLPRHPEDLVSKAMDIFYEVREVPGLKKKPSTSELLDWLKLLLNEDMPLDVLQNRDPTKAIPPLHGALLKNEQDVMLFERLAFMARRNG